jgi:predicted DNA binding CopG/RHH family protein
MEMPKKPAAARKKDRLNFRITDHLRDELEQEASEQGLDLSAYIRHLLLTDPRRQKSAKEKK